MESVETSANGNDSINDAAAILASTLISLMEETRQKQAEKMSELNAANTELTDQISKVQAEAKTLQSEIK